MARIMVVDDTAFLRFMLREILEKHGHSVICEATDGVDAIEKYKAFRPDLVTMDITMPNMQGTEAVKHIVAHDPQAKIVMCSAMGQKDLIIESIKSGAKSFIVKPFHASTVIETIDKIIPDSSPRQAVHNG